MSETRKVGETTKQAGNRGKGRKKGIPNKLTLAAKEAIAFAFNKLGGPQGLVEWAEESDDNRKAFYTQIWPKIIPLQVAGDDDGGPLRVILQSHDAAL